MVNKIQIKRGNFANIPTLDEGEFGFSTDTKQLHIGHTVDGNQEIATKAYVEEAVEYYDLIKADTIAPFGMMFDESDTTPSVTIVNADGEEFTPSDNFFNWHEIFNIGRCLIDPDDGNAITMGTNMRGDGLSALDGTAGDVMTRFNNVKYRYELDGTKKYLWFAPFESNLAYYDYHPNCYQGGNTTPHKHFYWGTYEASGYLDVATFKLRSATGKVPVTGGVSYPDLPNTGRFTMDDAILYAGNKGPGWNITHVWSNALVQSLIYMYYQTRDTQTALGQGVCNLTSGVDFAGVNTGASSIDSNLDIYGNGVGTGTNGEVPVCWKVENLYGNVWKWLPGINQYNSDQKTRLLNPDGSGTLAATLADGDYTILDGLCALTDGYYSGVFDEEYGAISFMPKTLTASSDTGFTDYSYYPRYNPSIVRSGGGWYCGLCCGPGFRAAGASASSSGRTYGARLEFVKPA